MHFYVIYSWQLKSIIFTAEEEIEVEKPKMEIVCKDVESAKIRFWSIICVVCLVSNMNVL